MSLISIAEWLVPKLLAFLHKKYSQQGTKMSTTSPALTLQQQLVAAEAQVAALKAQLYDAGVSASSNITGGPIAISITSVNGILQVLEGTLNTKVASVTNAASALLGGLEQAGASLAGAGGTTAAQIP